NVLRDLRELGGARRAYEEALAIRESLGLCIDAAGTCGNLGLLEDDEDPASAIEWFSRCIEECERGLRQLAEREYRARFQARIEPAYLRLIAHEAARPAGHGQAPPRRLVGLLESLRQVETLSGLGVAEGGAIEPAGWETAFDEILGADGDRPAGFRRQNAAL